MCNYAKLVDGYSADWAQDDLITNIEKCQKNYTVDKFVQLYNL